MHDHDHNHDHNHDHEHEPEPGHRHEHDHDHDHEHHHGLGDLAGALVGRWWKIATVLAAAGYLLSGIRVVGPAERGIVQRFGRVINDHVASGIHIGLPVGIERLTRIEIAKSRRVGVGVQLSDRILGTLPDPAISQFFSGDRNIIDIQLSVQYVIEEPTEFLFGSREPAALVRDACEAALCRVVGTMPVDRILTTGKAEVQRRVRTLANEALQRHGVGVRITSVTQERAAPPERVADAFRGVNSARADSERMVAEAEGYRDDLLPRARGQARAILEQAEADAYGVVALATGEAARFSEILAEAAAAGDLTRRRLHAEALEEILKRTRSVLVSPEAAGDIRFVEEAP